MTTATANRVIPMNSEKIAFEELIARMQKESRQKTRPVIKREKLESFLFSQHGKFVSIDFFKKNNMIRTLNGRLGVYKHVKGVRGWDMANRHDLSYVTVYEVPKPNTGVTGGYRNVNLETIEAVRANGIEYDVC